MAFSDQVSQTDRATLAAFGVPVTYTPAGGNPPAVPVTGIFDALFVLVKGSAQAGAEATAPAVFLLLADLPTDPEVDDPTITIGSVTYDVVGRHPDGMGGIVLELRTVT